MGKCRISDRGIRLSRLFFNWNEAIHDRGIMAPGSQQREKCPDCIECQMCSNNRCRICRKGAHVRGQGQLGPCLTHGEYLEWKRKMRLNED